MGLCVKCDILGCDEIIGDVLAQVTKAWHWGGRGGGRMLAWDDNV